MKKQIADAFMQNFSCRRPEKQSANNGIDQECSAKNFPPGFSHIRSELLKLVHQTRLDVNRIGKFRVRYTILYCAIENQKLSLPIHSNFENVYHWTILLNNKLSLSIKKETKSTRVQSQVNPGPSIIKQWTKCPPAKYLKIRRETFSLAKGFEE